MMLWRLILLFFALPLLSCKEETPIQKEATKRPPKEWFVEKMKSSPILKKAYEEGLVWRKTQQAHMRILRDAIKSHKIPHLKEKVKQALQRQIQDWKVYEAKLKELGTAVVGCPLMYNRIGLAASFALSYLESGFFEEALEGDLLDQEVPDLVFEDDDSIWSSTKGRALKTLLTTAWLVSSGKTLDQIHTLFGEDWMTTSPLYTVFNLPKELPTDHDFIFAKDGKTFLAEPHNGYIFGGAHGDEPVQELKNEKFPGLDCSTIVSKYLGLQGDIAPSTGHWVLHFVGPNLTEKNTPEAWKEKLTKWRTGEDSVYRLPLEKGVVPVKITSPDQLESGMVYVVKTFDPERIKKSPTIGLTGAGGHMGFVVGTHGDTLYIYTAATEPKSEFKVGDHDLHGIQAVPLNPNNHKKIFYFKSTM